MYIFMYIYIHIKYIFMYTFIYVFIYTYIYMALLSLNEKTNRPTDITFCCKLDLYKKNIYK